MSQTYPFISYPSSQIRTALSKSSPSLPQHILTSLIFLKCLKLSFSQINVHLPAFGHGFAQAKLSLKWRLSMKAQWDLRAVISPNMLQQSSKDSLEKRDHFAFRGWAMKEQAGPSDVISSHRSPPPLWRTYAGIEWLTERWHWPAELCGKTKERSE